MGVETDPYYSYGQTARRSLFTEFPFLFLKYHALHGKEENGAKHTCTREHTTETSSRLLLIIIKGQEASWIGVGGVYNGDNGNGASWVQWVDWTKHRRHKTLIIQGTA